MWRRKTDDEVARLIRDQTKQSLNPRTPIVLSLGSGAIAALVGWIFGEPSLKAPFTLSLDNFLLTVIGTALLVFFFTYALQLLMRAPFLDAENFRICPSCLEAMIVDEENCQCGRKMEPASWYDEDGLDET